MDAKQKMMDLVAGIFAWKYLSAVVISVAGGLAAATIKGARTAGQIVSIVVVALVAGIWVSPLLIALLDAWMDLPVNEELPASVHDSITAITAISSWNILEALVENRVASRILKKFG